MRNLLPRGLSALIVVLALAAASEAQAQARYQPSRPTVSPYMNLFRGNVGPLPNYYSLVRPQINQLAFDRDVATVQLQQKAGLNMLQTQVGKQAATPTGKHSGFNTYGRQTFMTAPSGASGGRR